MPFKEFHNNCAKRGMPRISILRDGRLSINQACFTRYFDAYKYVILMYDETTNKIGLKPTNDDSKNARRINQKKGKSYAQIGAKAFLDYLNIPVGETTSYNCDWNTAEELLEIQLDHTILEQS